MIPVEPPVEQINNFYFFLVFIYVFRFALYSKFSIKKLGADKKKF